MSAEIYVAHDSQKGVVIGKGCATAGPAGAMPARRMRTLASRPSCGTRPALARFARARHSGAALKKVGTSARKKMETFFDKKVFLETRVKVRANWRQDKKSLEEFGKPPG